MEIPHQRLKPATLRAVIQEFVSREGTDYGEHNFTLDEKVAHVMAQLEQGKAVLVTDESTETCHIVVRGPLSSVLTGSSRVSATAEKVPK